MPRGYISSQRATPDWYNKSLLNFLESSRSPDNAIKHAKQFSLSLDTPRNHVLYANVKRMKELAAKGEISKNDSADK